MQIIKLSAGYMLVTPHVHILFSDAGYNECGHIELTKNNVTTGFIDSSQDKEFEKSFIQLGGVML